MAIKTNGTASTLIKDGLCWLLG